MGISGLENKNLIIEVESLGAELQKIYSKKRGRDYLWNGDSSYWNRRSPILFPIVGQLQGDRVEIDGSMYKLSRHGFARDCEFKLIAQNEAKLEYELQANDATRKMYPYDFKLYVSYKINDEEISSKSIIEVGYKVVNEGKDNMFFSLGGHPAFRIPHKTKEQLRNYRLLLEGREELKEYIMNPPYIKEEKIISNPEELVLDRDLFINDTLIYGGLDRITLVNNEEGIRLSVDFPGFPYSAIWSRVNSDTDDIAPFICIEPWYGIADYEATPGGIEKKQGIEKLLPGNEFSVKYTIEID